MEILRKEMNKTTIKVLMSSKGKNWETPDSLFKELDDLFGFELDVCANKKNRKVKKYYGIKDNAFKKKWKGVCWMNPPYGKSENACKDDCSKKICVERGYHLEEYLPGVSDWVEKAIKESGNRSTTIVCLLPARTETDWFQSVWDNADILLFLKGRLKFVGAKEVAPFPSVIAVFSSWELHQELTEDLCLLGNVFFRNAKFGDWLNFTSYHISNIKKKKERIKTEIKSIKVNMENNRLRIKSLKKQYKEL
jgi:phage N-6-adenine-methyltransferase